jgi:hypothetical protein
MRGHFLVAPLLLHLNRMSPLSKILLAVVLFAPGGLLLAPVLWLERRWQQRRNRLATPEQQRAAA